MTESPPHVYTSLNVYLEVAEPTTMKLTAQEKVRIDRMAYSEEDGVTADRYGDLLPAGTSTVHLDQGKYSFRTEGEARLHVTESKAMTVVSFSGVKCIPPPPLARSAPVDGLAAFETRGGALPGQAPALTVTYGDAR
jgi:hypothetical protein